MAGAALAIVDALTPLRVDILRDQPEIDFMIADVNALNTVIIRMWEYHVLPVKIRALLDGTKLVLKLTPGGSEVEGLSELATLVRQM